MRYFTTDCDGVSKQGHQILGKRCAWLLVPECWAHQLDINLTNTLLTIYFVQFQLTLGDYFKDYKVAQEIVEQASNLIGWINSHGKVQKIFDSAQWQISWDQLNRELVLAYLIANLTQWTTHSTAFTRLFNIWDALQLAVIQHHSGIVQAQVGAAKSSEARHLTEDADMHIKIIQDCTFWDGLEQVIGDIKPICYATNINQTNSCHPDTVLRTLAGIYLHFKDHPEPKVATKMTGHVEKCWKGAYQPLFLLCQILNPFEGMAWFGDGTDLSQLKCEALIMEVSENDSNVLFYLNMTSERSTERWGANLLTRTQWG